MDTLQVSLDINYSYDKHYVYKSVKETIRLHGNTFIYNYVAINLHAINTYLL
jgi:hypothetical protein